MLLPSPFWRRRALSVFFYIQALSLHQRLVSSLSLQHNSAHSSVIGIDSHSQHGQQEEHNNHLLPAFTGIRLKFYTTETIPVTSSESKQQQQQHLFLRRLDGIELYGREIVHTACDATLAIMSSSTKDDDDEASENDSWDVTLLLRPDSAEINKATPIWLQSQSCFVAMNRFQVKEDCRALFEERWSRRNSKLSYQPGFVGFSLLRKRTTSNTTNNEIDRFNYSTCTIWDSIESWNQWRNGGGRTSHEASRDKTRVPVSEWLEGPSSPIFWDGSTSFAANGTHADHESQTSPLAVRQ